MHSLANYIEERTKNLYKNCGAFFAFSRKQFDEAKQDCVKYVDLGGGLLCPKKNVKELITLLDKAIEESIEQDKADNGEVAIIKRELSNYESYYTGDPTNAIEALEGYGFKEENIISIFKEELVKFH